MATIRLSISDIYGVKDVLLGASDGAAVLAGVADFIESSSAFERIDASAQVAAVGSTVAAASGGFKLAPTMAAGGFNMVALGSSLYGVMASAYEAHLATDGVERSRLENEVVVHALNLVGSMSSIVGLAAGLAGNKPLGVWAGVGGAITTAYGLALGSGQSLETLAGRVIDELNAQNGALAGAGNGLSAAQLAAYDGARQSLSSSLSLLSGVIVGGDTVLSQAQIDSLTASLQGTRDAAVSLYDSLGAGEGDFTIYQSGNGVTVSEATTGAVSFSQGIVALEDGRIRSSFDALAQQGYAESLTYSPDLALEEMVQRSASGAYTVTRNNLSGGPVETTTLAYNSNGELVRNIAANADSTVDVIHYGLADGAFRQDTYNSSSQLVSSVVTRMDGGKTNITYEPGGGEVAAFETDVSASGAVTRQVTYNTDGSYFIRNGDGTVEYGVASGEMVLNQALSNKALGGNFLDGEYAVYVNAVATTLAVQLSRLLFADNLPAALAAGAFSGATINTAFGNSTYQVDGITLGESQAFLVNFGYMLAGAVGGMAGAELGREFFGALGLPEDIGAGVGGLVGSVSVQYLAREVAEEFIGVAQIGPNGAVVANSFSASLVSGGVATAGSFFGSKLSELVIGDGSTESQIGGAVGSALGAAIGSSGGPAGTFIGSFIGDFIGSIFGGLFGSGYQGEPNAWQYASWNYPTREFLIHGGGADNGGSAQIPHDVMAAEIAQIAAVLRIIGGEVVPSGGAGATGYEHAVGYYSSDFYFSWGNVIERSHLQQFDSSEQVAGHAIMQVLRSLAISGGNDYVKLAIQRSTAASYEQFISHINAAYDYSIYVQNPLAFDVYLAQKNDPVQWQNWRQEIAYAQALGLDSLSHGELVMAGAITSLASTIRSVVINGNSGEQETIVPAAGSLFNIILAAGTDASSFWFRREADDLVLTFFRTGHRTSIQGWFTGNDALLQSIVVADGSDLGADVVAGLAADDGLTESIITGAAAGQQVVYQDFGFDVFGLGEKAKIAQGPDGRVGVVQFDGAGQLVARLWLTEAGAPAALAAGASIIGSAAGPDGMDHSLVIRTASGAFEAWTFAGTGAARKEDLSGAVYARSSDGGLIDTLVVTDARSYYFDLRGNGGAAGLKNVDALASSGNVTIIGGENERANNIIRGGSGADTIYAHTGDDVVLYAANDLVVDGGTGIDTLVVASSATMTVDLSNTYNHTPGLAATSNFENVDASASTAGLTLIGSAEANVLIGGSGSDRIVYDAADVLTDGGAGSDTLVLAGATSYTVDLRNADQVAGGGETRSFENVDGSAATAGSTIIGGEGAFADNVIRGGSGADTIYAHTGNDIVYFDANDIVVDGGTGTDTLVLAGGAAYSVDLRQANNVLSGGGANNFENVDASAVTVGVTIIGGENERADNIIRGGSGADTIYAHTGNDIVYFDANDMVVDGGTGTDTLVLAGGAAYSVDLRQANNVLSGGGANNFENVDASAATAGVTIIGGENERANNVIRGGSGADIIYAHTGNDIVHYAANDVVVDGGTGTDTLVVASSAAMTVDLSNTYDHTPGLAATSNFESVDASASTAGLTLIGSAEANVLIGGSGSDRIVYDAADVLTDGGAGSDTLVLGGATSHSVDLRNADQVAGGGETRGFENVDGSAATAGSTIIGGEGGFADNIIRGGAGADIIYAHTGNDIVYFDANDIVVDGGTGTDTLVLTGGAAYSVDLRQANNVLSGGGANNFENVDASGVTAGVTIIGGENERANNVIRGGSGADIIYAHTGDDIVHYAANYVVVDGGTGTDTLVVASSTAMTVDLSNTYNHTPGLAATSNFESVDASASTAGLTLIGSAEANVLIGGSGNDVLRGGAGNDTYQVARGGGADAIFDTDATAGNVDMLSFASGVAHDQLWFRQSGNDLEIGIIGTNDRVTVDSWYAASDRHVERIRAGGMELVDTSVAALVNAMAAMAPPPFGQTTLTGARHQQLDPTLNASWHVAA